MTTISAPLDDGSAARLETQPRRRQWPPAAGLALGLLGLWMALSGGAQGVAGALLCALATAWFIARRDRASAPAQDDPVDEPAIDSSAEPSSAGSGAAVMVEQVVPVWSRQLEATRGTTDDGLSALLASFSAMSTSFDALLGGLGSMTASAGPGAVDHAVGAAAPELAALLAPSMRAFAERDAAVAELAHCAQSMAQLEQWSRQAREIARHTRLVAFNASIEANRDAASTRGHQAVAHEMRALADRLGEAGESIGRTVVSLGERLGDTQRACELRDTTPPELRIELELRAREALAAMLASLGASLQTSGVVRDASAALRTQLEEVFVQFQFGDRVSQMLSIIGNDMNHFAHWAAQHPQATATDAADWLARLESSYTMEEQRSEHHGNVHIDRGSEVEFF